MNSAIKAPEETRCRDRQHYMGKVLESIEREKLCQVFADGMYLSTSVLEPFLWNKLASKKVLQMSIALADMTDNFTNRIADRVALLSFALAAANMLHHWVDVPHLQMHAIEFKSFKSHY